VASYVVLLKGTQDFVIGSTRSSKRLSGLVVYLTVATSLWLLNQWRVMGFYYFVVLLSGKTTLYEGTDRSGTCAFSSRCEGDDDGRDSDFRRGYISIIIIASCTVDWLDIGSHSPTSSTSAEPSMAFIYESGEKATDDERRRFGCLAIVHERRFDGSAV
jgi:hypothetical protein